MHLARALKVTRVYNRETVLKFSQDSNIPAEVILGVEGGEILANPDVLNAYAKCFRIDPKVLRFFDTDANPQNSREKIRSFLAEYSLRFLEYLAKDD